MTMLERSIYIDAPIEEVAPLVDDPKRWPEYFVGLEKVDPDSLFPDVGGVAQVAYKAAGMTFNIRMTSTEFERGKTSVTKMEGMMSGINSTSLESEGAGTKITMSFEYEMPGGGIGKAIDKLLVERMNAEQLEESLEKLKVLVEA
jgi:carbon monoxide dehydrogenase subunit G